MGQDTIELDVIDLHNPENKSKLDERTRLVVEKRTFLYNDILAIATLSKYKFEAAPKSINGQKKRGNLLFIKGTKDPYLLKKPISDIEALLWDDFARCTRGNLIKISPHLFVNRDACNTPISKDRLVVDGIERPLSVSQAEALSFNALWKKHKQFMEEQGPKAFGKLLVKLGEDYEKSRHTLSKEVLEKRDHWMANIAAKMREGVEEYIEEQKKNPQNKEEK